VSDDPDAWALQRTALGTFIRNQRQLARLSLRQLAEVAKVSNPYLSQLERGLHEPSMRVLQGIADALGVSVEQILAQAGVLPTAGQTSPPPTLTEDAIRADPLLTAGQKDALLSVYRSYVATTAATAAPPTPGAGAEDAGAPVSRPAIAKGSAVDTGSASGKDSGAVTASSSAARHPTARPRTTGKKTARPARKPPASD
jgi:transcriptional regulator with XRE-family HTH domain